MLYEIWDRYPNDDAQCYGVVHSSAEAQALCEQVRQSGINTAEILVFMPYTDTVAYRITPETVVVPQDVFVDR